MKYLTGLDVSLGDETNVPTYYAVRTVQRVWGGSPGCSAGDGLLTE